MIVSIDRQERLTAYLGGVDIETLPTIAQDLRYSCCRLEDLLEALPPKKGEDAESELVSVAEEVAWQLEERATELEELVDQNTIS